VNAAIGVNFDTKTEFQGVSAHPLVLKPDTGHLAAATLGQVTALYEETAARPRSMVCAPIQDRATDTPASTQGMDYDPTGHRHCWLARQASPGIRSSSSGSNTERAKGLGGCGTDPMIAVPDSSSRRDSEGLLSSTLNFSLRGVGLPGALGGTTLAGHAPEMRMFDVPPPFESKGLEEYRRAWDLFFSTSEDPAVFDFDEMEITAGRQADQTSA
jgi:hypothetical protein